MQIRATQGDTVDAICWRYLGTTEDTVEQVLLLNPKLAELGPVLPMGTVLTLPAQVEIKPKKEYGIEQIPHNSPPPPSLKVKATL